MKLQSPALCELSWRGLIKDCTNLFALDEVMKSPQKFYVGFDLTAKSLHVGNLVSLMMARILARHGHFPILLLGGATTKIGDPTGKDATRPVLSQSEIALNREGILCNFKQILADFRYGIEDNYSWFEGKNYIDFLRNIGTHFTLNRMMAMDSVKERLGREQSMSFVELNYMLLQSYDFLHLYQKHGCILQVGGSDQWGNIAQGVDLIPRFFAANGRKPGEIFGLTSPLVTRSDGKKNGEKRKWRDLAGRKTSGAL